MPEYVVRLLAPDGRAVEQRVRAPDRQGVAAALGVPSRCVLSVGLATADATPARRGLKAPVPRLSSLRGAPRSSFPARLFSQELAVLLDAGIPLLEALETLAEKEARVQVAAAIKALVDDLRTGLPLSEALGRQRERHGDLLLAIVAASERTGQLSASLRQHAAYLGWIEGLRARLLAAAMYPMLLLAAGGAVMLFLLLFVLPRFALVLEDLGHGDLPWASRALLHLGQLADAHPGAVMGGLLAAGLAAAALWRSTRARAALVALSWRAPWLGERLRVLALARLYRTLGMLLSTGVPVAQALVIAQRVVAAPDRAALEAATLRVSQGGRLSEALDRHGLATPVSRRMVRVGERSGQLAGMLERAAAFHDEEVVRFTDFVTRALSPVLMLIMGLLIGGIVVLMYLPIFQLAEQIQ